MLCNQSEFQLFDFHAMRNGDVSFEIFALHQTQAVDVLLNIVKSPGVGEYIAFRTLSAGAFFFFASGVLLSRFCSCELRKKVVCARISQHIRFKVRRNLVLFGVIKRGYWHCRFLLDHSMPHFLVIFTSRNITNATMMKVITATKKSPIPNICPL